MATIASLEYFLQKIPFKEKARFRAAYVFAREQLSGVLRRSGENYFVHGAEVAQALFEINPDPSLARVLLLHDLLVHPEGAALLKISPLTAEEKKLVQRMHALRRLNIDQDTHDLDYVITEFSQDGRLLVMRMAHRLNDIRHIDRFSNFLKNHIANESLHMYTAIAGRLGLHAWRYEMEDLCFRLLYPDIARRLDEQFKASADLDRTCLHHTRDFLTKEFRKNKVSPRIEMRIKSVYSTYRKMVEKKRGFHELTDRLALRIVVDDLEDCYRVLGMVHRIMHPIPGKLKDYIGAPKQNGYQSLHTVVYPLPGVTEQPMEIQIRTQEMDSVCEYGVAAHHLYKEKASVLGTHRARVDLFRNLEILKTQARSPEEFETALRNYFKEEQLLIFDSANHLYHLKKPATALDFACLVYGKRCSRLKKVRVNGRDQILSTPLHDGDVVEVQFGRLFSYERQWRSLVLHQKSKEVLKALR